MSEEKGPDGTAVDVMVTADYSIRQPARVEYRPQADITAHEVARLLPILIRLQHMMYPENHIPADLMRHFEIWRPA